MNKEITWKKLLIEQRENDYLKKICTVCIVCISKLKFKYIDGKKLCSAVNQRGNKICRSFYEKLWKKSHCHCHLYEEKNCTSLEIILDNSNALLSLYQNLLRFSLCTRHCSCCNMIFKLPYITLTSMQSLALLSIFLGLWCDKKFDGKYKKNNLFCMTSSNKQYAGKCVRSCFLLWWKQLWKIRFSITSCGGPC